MNGTHTRSARNLGVAAMVAGLVEMAFAVVMGIGRFLPLPGAVALILGAASLARAAAGRPARWIAVVAVFFAALGVTVVVLLLWFLSHIEFTF